MNHICEPQTSNVTAGPGRLGGHRAWEVALIVLVTGLLSFFTILGNLLVVVSFRVNHQLRTISNYYLLSLAVADLTLGMVSMNLYTAYIIMGRWMLGNLACDLWLALDYVASNASVMNLLVISFDRYFSVTRPLTYRIKRTPKRAALLIALAWVVSFLLWAPAILFWPHTNGQPSEDKKDCSIPFQAVPSLTFGTAIAAFYLPVCIMIILYWRIYWEIENRANGLAKFVGSRSSSKTNTVRASKWSHSSQNSLGSSSGRNSRKNPQLARQASPGCFPMRHKETIPVPCNISRQAPSRNAWNTDEDDSETSSTTEDEQEQDKGQSLPGSDPAEIKLKDVQESSEGHQKPSLCSLNQRRILDLASRRRKRKMSPIIREKKAARTLSAILLAFILTWTPYNIMVLASISYCVPEKLWQLGYWLCYVNSTVNPMCYALCNKSFRATFKTLLQCRWREARKWEGTNHSHRATSRANNSCSNV